MIREHDKLPWLEAAFLVVAQIPYVFEQCRRGNYRYGRNPLGGLCYTASEALAHLTDDPLYPMWVRFGPKQGDTHWWLRHADTGQDIDLTASQFPAVDFYSIYGRGRRRAFGSTQPSKRAQLILDRIDRDHVHFRHHGPRGVHAAFLSDYDWNEHIRQTKEAKDGKKTTTSA